MSVEVVVHTIGCTLPCGERSMFFVTGYGNLKILEPWNSTDTIAALIDFQKLAYSSGLILNQIRL